MRGSLDYVPRSGDFARDDGFRVRASVFECVAVGAVAAARVAAGAAFEVVGGGEDKVRAVEVEVGWI